MPRAPRREKNLLPAGHGVMRHGATLLPLTPSSTRREMIEAGRIDRTTLDRMLSDDEASALERWALNEQGISGTAKTVQWSDQPRGSGRTDYAPIADHLMTRLVRHGRVKRSLDAKTLEVLAAFTALQNRLEGALMPANYGLRFGAQGRDKRAGFYAFVVLAAKALVEARY